MTHTLHRQGAIEDLHEDYAMLFLLSRMKPQGTSETMKQIWGVLSGYEYNLVNFGNHHPNWGGGDLYRMEDLKKSDNSRMIMAVFKDRETLTNCLKEIKERNFGMSVVVSGLYKEIGKTCAETGLKPHTVNISLGIHGNTKKLPEKNVLEIHTMCGHAMVSSKLIIQMVENIKAGEISHEAAAKELSRMCDCGIFNTYRAGKVLRKMTAIAD
jgi:hypothetical protein